MYRPKVSIGVPVYNGENFIGEAIESFLSQSFDDFELIISDNASIDSTEAICKYYQTRDGRIKYSRNSKNLGAARNYNKVFTLSSGKYFKWAAHDDICHQRFLECCVNTLDKDDSVVLAYTEYNYINEEGDEILSRKRSVADFSSEVVWKRFRGLIGENGFAPIFGLIRSEVLMKTPLLGSFPMHDYILLADLSLYGKFYCIPDLLFSLRRHPSCFGKAVWNPHRPGDSVAWFDTLKSGSVSLPYWRRTYEHFSSCTKAELTFLERFLCFMIITNWAANHGKELAKDLAFALYNMLGIMKKVSKIE
ncbi:MAG: glycosyltransferase [Chlamydiota bacterium]